jgi:lipopolysaccharide/colanic/teichoic acid biosynthesis glycosyltransferase
VNLRRSTNGNGLASDSPFPTLTASADRKLLNEESFQRMIALERKRTERSRNSLLLMLLDAGEQQSDKINLVLHKILGSLTTSTRETDLTGWYKNNLVVGVMFTEVVFPDRNAILSTILARVSEVLRNELTTEQFTQINISFHLYPEAWGLGDSKLLSNPTLYPDLLSRDESKRSMHVVKRSMDLIGSVLLLVLLSPFLLLIAAAIRASSSGPVFFRQRRVGRHGRTFELLKFRSMCANNDPTIHREYVTKAITGFADQQVRNDGAVFKLTDDPRVTRLGYWLRKSSMDELPQLFNVLTGEMSLVGPRPPVDYEVAVYDLWHRARLLEAKPGITGLWQVSGRNRIKFDDMVRLDLTYARTWSPWLDLKILLRTPLAVLEGAH